MFTVATCDASHISIDAYVVKAKVAAVCAAKHAAGRLAACDGSKHGWSDLQRTADEHWWL